MSDQTGAARKVALVAILLAIMGFVYASSISGGGGGVSFGGAQVDLNGSTLVNGTFSSLNDTKVNKSGDIMTGGINMTDGKIWIGTPAKAAWNDIAITRTNQSGVSMGFDVVTVNATGNTRAIFRVTAGSTADPNTNTNLPFVAYSDTYAAPWPGVVRAVCFLCLEERIGVSTVPLSAPSNTMGNISFYTQNYTKTQYDTPGNGGSGNGALSMRLDGNGDLYLYGYNYSGTGSVYLCINKATGKIFVGNPGC